LNDLVYSINYNVRLMDYSVYRMFDLTSDSTPHEILAKCKERCSQWTLTNVRERLMSEMSTAEASVNAEVIYEHGLCHLKAVAAMLLNPSAKQCYDAWLDTRVSPSPEKIALTRSRLLWFNQTNKNIHFSDNMITSIGNVRPRHNELELPAKVSTQNIVSNPQCRVCRCSFDFSKDYLVLHCHCTTRVGHVECLNNFAGRVAHKCPVCRQQLLQRHQVSKYLFWNVKEKYKFIA